MLWKTRKALILAYFKKLQKKKFLKGKLLKLYGTNKIIQHPFIVSQDVRKHTATQKHEEKNPFAEAANSSTASNPFAGLGLYKPTVSFISTTVPPPPKKGEEAPPALNPFANLTFPLIPVQSKLAIATSTEDKKDEKIEDDKPTEEPPSSAEKNNEAIHFEKVDFEAAWALLQPEMATDPDTLSAVLEVLSVDGPDSLKYALQMDKENVHKIAETLNEAPQLRFQEMFV
jgi:hypothetical protein